MSKLASQRPSASDVLEALARLSGGAVGAAGPIAAVPAVAPTVVGRDRALSELAAAFEEIEAGRGRMVAISGEAGIGKTTLVERFLDGLAGRRAPMVTGRGQCSERLSGAEAYLPWLEVLGSLKDKVGRPLVETLRPLAPSWHAQIAPLSTGDSPEARLVTVNRGGSQEWLKRELALFLEETARTKPIVLFVEDVHWADVSTVDLLAYVAARLDAGTAARRGRS